MSGHSKSTFTEFEELRLKALDEYNILDTAEEKEFDNLAALAAHICEVPYAQINFIDRHRQWSKARYGVDFKEIPRNAGFCHHTIQYDQKMIIKDTSKDIRFKDMPFVQDDPGIRFYAGFNVKGPKDTNLGTVCVIGTKPKELNESQQLALDTLAREVEARLELSKKNEELETTATFLESSVDMMLIVDPASTQIERYSNKVVDFFGLDGAKTNKMALKGLFPDQNFIQSVKKWDSCGSSSRFKSITHFEKNNKEVFFEISVKKQKGKWLMVGRNVSEERLYQKKLENLLKEKNVLLAEVHHRVKNNLAVISGILQLEELKCDREDTREKLFKNYMRVQSMGMIHEELYQHKDFVNLSFDQFLLKLTKLWQEDEKTTSKNISISTELHALSLNLNQAVPCALIVNELISNSVEFGFEGRDQGNIHIELKTEGSDVSLMVKDDGVGLPDNFDLSSSPNFGTTLVYSYSEQLNSDIEMKSDGGAMFRLTFQKNDKMKGSSGNDLVV